MTQNDAARITRILPPAELTDEHQRLLVKYLRLPRSLSRMEWSQALTTFDLLHHGQVRQGRRTWTFQTYYQRAIDDLHATDFLTQLLAEEDPEVAGKSLMAEHWRDIFTALTTQGVTEETVEGRLLLAYCLYWWQNFCKGYVREVTIFRDLEQAGIAFESHDLRDPTRRRSAYDLLVRNRHGDIKTSTYFLYNVRFFPLRCDFYIVRLFDEITNRWLDAVLLKPAVWHELDGEPTLCTWQTVAQTLPAVAQVEMRDETLVVVSYAEWKARILQMQAIEGESKP